MLLKKAIEAVVRSMPSPKMMERLEKLIAPNPRFARAFRSLTNP